MNHPKYQNKIPNYLNTTSIGCNHFVIELSLEIFMLFVILWNNYLYEKQIWDINKYEYDR